MLRKLALSLAVAGVIGASNASALGLGEIHIKSALNEPLEAEIQLLQMRDVDPGLVQPRMANIDEFALAGIEKLRFLSNVKFEVRNRADGRGVIHMTSATPVKEPFLNFLVEVNWPSGRLVREYTVLLDPPIYDPTPSRSSIQPAQSQPVKGAATVSSQQLPASSAKPVNNIRTRANPESQVYVDVNDTLWDIAKKHRPAANVTEAQMMLALQRKNPAAFSNNNVNQLKAGVVLDIPTLQEVQSLTPKQASDEFWRQTATWRQGGVANPKSQQVVAARKKEGAEPKKGNEVAGESVAGQLKIVSPSQNKTPEAGVVADQSADKEIDQEKVALTEENQQLEAQLATALESVDQIQRENEELSGRVDALAQQMESLQRLLELKDQQLATLQAELEAAKQQPVIAAPAPEPVANKSLLDEFGLYIAGAGAALVALLVGLLLLMLGRRRKQKQEDEASQAVPEVAAVAAVAAAEDIAEADVAGDVEAESVTDVAEAVVEEDVAAELEDEDFSDLDLDLDLEMDLEDVAAEQVVPEQVDDEEFDLGLDDLEQTADAVAVADSVIDESPADEALVADEPVEEEEVDDALDAILGEDTESIDLDDELTFDVQPVVEENIVESVSDEVALEGLDFNLDDAAVDSSVTDELDVELLDDSEEPLPELEMDIASDEEELADLDALLGGSSDDVEESLAEDAVSEGIESEDIEDDLSDLDMLLADVGESGFDELEADEAMLEETELDEPEAAESVEQNLDELLAEIEEPLDGNSIDEDLVNLDELLTEAWIEEPLDGNSIDEDQVNLDELLAETEIEEHAAGDSIDEDLVNLDELLTEAGIEEPLDGNSIDEDLVNLDELFTEAEIEESADGDSVDEDLVNLDELLTEAEIEESADGDSVDQDAFNLDELLTEVELEEPVDGASIEDEIADLDELLNDSESLVDAPVEDVGAAQASALGLHPDLEDLLGSVGDDIVLEKQDVDSGIDDSLEATISHDLEAELDSELQSLLNGAGDSDVALAEIDDDEDSFGGLNLLDGADEVETKLDLARAYIDMEDIDGAKDILQEVVSEGSDSQQKEANNLIESINS